MPLSFSKAATMDNTALPETPPFETLPLQKDGPPGNAWGLFGENDKLGTLNRLTQRNTVEAAKEIQEGLRISTDWTLLGPEFPSFRRQPFRHHVHQMLPRCVNDDILTFNTQSSTQWDGFRHYGGYISESPLSPVVVRATDKSSQGTKPRGCTSTASSRRNMKSQHNMALMAG